MKKVAKITGRALCYDVLECPICEARTVVNENMPWCATCGTEYYHGRDDRKTGARRWVFDTKRKTPQYAWGKALNLSGGIRIGPKK